MTSHSLTAWRESAAEEHEVNLAEVRKEATLLRESVARFEAARDEGNKHVSPDRHLLQVIYEHIDVMDAAGPPLWPVGEEEAPYTRQKAVLDALCAHNTRRWPCLDEVQTMCRNPAKLMDYTVACGIRFPVVAIGGFGQSIR